MSVEELQYVILKELNKSNTPIGASLLSLKIDASQATIGRVLQWLEFKHYIQKASNKGRLLTDEGKAYLAELDATFAYGEITNQLVTLIASQDINIYIKLLHVRLLLERDAVYNATVVVTDEQLNRLESIINHEIKQRDLGWFGDDDNRNFHLMIANIAGNEVVEQLIRLILFKTDSNLHLSFLQYRKILMRNSQAHFDIFNAMKAHDPQKAAMAMEAYIQSLIDDATQLSQDHLIVGIEIPNGKNGDNELN